jgi:single-stranded-DNA-specific exonuclease
VNRLLWKTIHKCEFNKEDDFLERILAQAGIDNIYEFLNVSKKHTHNPFLFKNMDKGVELLHSKLGGTVFIKRDTDVDGLTSSSYCKGFIKDISPETEVICETTYQKEHGLFVSDIEQYADNIDLIIVPDAGSSSVEECKEITEKYHIPILILDHHEINEEVMNYATLINCTDGEYPNPTLSGVGVVHKFALAYASKYGIKEEVCNYYLDLVALGMIADSMDMRNLETRYYALEGLKEENRHNLLIKEIAARYEDEMKLGHTIRNYGWVIAPKMNAVVRYGSKEEQDNLFRALCGEIEDIEYQPRRKCKTDPKPPVEIHSLQKTMARVCDNVKARQDTEVRKYVPLLEEQIKQMELDKNSVIIVDGTDILKTKTVTGLIANKLAEKYQRPIVILKSRDKELFGGSARGYEKGVIEDFRNFLIETNSFDECLGHAGAFGVTLQKNNLQKAIESCNRKLKLEDLITIHEVDYEVKARNLTQKAVMKVAESYEIWGKGVEEPTFVITEIEIPAKDIKGYGDNNTFIKFSYNNVDYIKKYCSKDDFDIMTLRDRNTLGENKKILHMTVIGTFNINEYEGVRYPQVRINYFESEEVITTSKIKVTIDDDFLF